MPVASAITARRCSFRSHVAFCSCVPSRPSRTLAVLPHGHSASTVRSRSYHLFGTRMSGSCFSPEARASAIVVTSWSLVLKVRVCRPGLPSPSDITNSALFECLSPPGTALRTGDLHHIFPQVRGGFRPTGAGLGRRPPPQLRPVGGGSPRSVGQLRRTAGSAGGARL